MKCVGKLHQKEIVHTENISDSWPVQKSVRYYRYNHWTYMDISHVQFTHLVIRVEIPCTRGKISETSTFGKGHAPQGPKTSFSITFTISWIAAMFFDIQPSYLKVYYLKPFSSRCPTIFRSLKSSKMADWRPFSKIQKMLDNSNMRIWEVL